MSKSHRLHSAEFKFKVALDAAKCAKTLYEFACAFSVHPNQVGRWKRILRETDSIWFLGTIGVD